MKKISWTEHSNESCNDVKKTLVIRIENKSRREILKSILLLEMWMMIVKLSSWALSIIQDKGFANTITISK